MIGDIGVVCVCVCYGWKQSKLTWALFVRACVSFNHKIYS